MKTVIFLLLWNVSFGQSYVAKWTGKPPFIVQRSTDGRTWKTVATTNDTMYVGANATYYWRVKTLNDTTNTVWAYAQSYVTSAKLRFSGSNAVLSWRGNTETNMNYYTIESISNITVVMKHGGSYTVSVPKIGLTYQIVAHYKNGDISILKTFNQ